MVADAGRWSGGGWGGLRVWGDRGGGERSVNGDEWNRGDEGSIRVTNGRRAVGAHKSFTLVY